MADTEAVKNRLRRMIRAMESSMIEREDLIRSNVEHNAVDIEAPGLVYLISHPLLVPIQEGDLEAVEKILSGNDGEKKLIEAIRIVTFPRTLIQFAVESGNKELAKYLREFINQMYRRDIDQLNEAIRIIDKWY